MDKNILKQLKTDYEDLEIKPSANLWEQIEAGLDSGSETVQKYTFHWWKYAAVIVLLISVGGLFYFNTDKSLDIKKTIVAKNPSENDFKLTETVVSTTTSKEEVNDESALRRKIVENNKEYPAVTEISKEDKISENLIVEEKQSKITEVPNLSMEKIDLPVSKPMIVEGKKASYISADDLLVGRELDKTREENYNDQRKFGVFDIRRVKGPNSLKIFGFTVISDSVEDK